MPNAPSPAPAENTTDISPAQGDALTQAMEAARAGVRNAADNSEIAADDAGQTAAAEQMNKPQPPPLG